MSMVMTNFAIIYGLVLLLTFLYKVKSDCLVTRELAKGKFISDTDSNAFYSKGHEVPVGNVIKVFCDPTYIPGPVANFKCLSDNTFDFDLDNAVCNEKQEETENSSEGCTVTKLITNGKFMNEHDKDKDLAIGSLVPVNTQLSVICNTGYASGPVTYFKCQSDGKFDVNLENASCNEQIQAIASDSDGCTVTTQVSNGKFINENNANTDIVIGSVIPVGNQLTVVCNAGYTVGSVEHFSCQPNTNFDVNLGNAFCNIQMQANTVENSIGCVVTATITNGKLIMEYDANTNIASGYIVPEGKQLSVMCDSGYESGPDKNFKCQSDSKFDVELAKAFCNEQT